MATLSLRMRDDLKAKAQQLASEQGVSLNSYINATLAATVAQAETLAMMGDRLSNVDREKLHARVMNFMSKSQNSPEPSPAEIECAVADRRS
jgi:antitoxin component of RelBE/YafQ-DinJ toxin-antitoxin module